MIGASNPEIILGLNHIPDFTIKHYRELLCVAKKNYTFTRYQSIPYGTRFVLWRHDCDFSLNRAYRLALIEQGEDVVSTYFINPHCEFYNLFEKSQTALVKSILEMGHDIGLHFDAAYYDISTEEQLGVLVANEALFLEKVFGVRPTAFSFHNPTAFLLTCEQEVYGGLLNCYSKRFKTNIPYCSDSNGYWRFRRLVEVLQQATDPWLQVLTHPGWWQEKALPPRQRVFRSVYGRAEKNLRFYDCSMERFVRTNVTGLSEALLFLKELNPAGYELCDYLWNKGRFQTLFSELWRLHERQINQLCKAVFRKEWQVPASEINAFFEHPKLGIDGWKLFMVVFEQSWQQATGANEDVHREWVTLRNQLIHGRSSIDPAKLEAGCAYLSGVIYAMAKWGKAQENIRYDGIKHLGSVGIPTVKTACGDFSEKLEEVVSQITNFPEKRWHEFKVAHLTDLLG